MVPHPCLEGNSLPGRAIHTPPLNAGLAPRHPMSPPEDRKRPPARQEAEWAGTPEPASTAGSGARRVRRDARRGNILAHRFSLPAKRRSKSRSSIGQPARVYRPASAHSRDLSKGIRPPLWKWSSRASRWIRVPQIGGPTQGLGVPLNSRTARDHSRQDSQRHAPHDVGAKGPSLPLQRRRTP